MSDRLSELVRQRALVLEHLAWIDREIAGESAKPAIPNVVPVPQPLGTISTHPASPAAQPTTTASPVAGATTATPTDVAASKEDEILEQYRVTPTAVKQDVKKGCFLYFAAAFVLLGVALTILYFAIGSR